MAMFRLKHGIGINALYTSYYASQYYSDYKTAEMIKVAI